MNENKQMSPNQNTLVLVGKVLNSPELAYASQHTSFYLFDIEVPRLSGENDILPILIPQRLLPLIQVNAYVELQGKMRTRNERNKLLVRGACHYVKQLTEEEFKEHEGPFNLIQMSCFTCKKPNYRVTPNGRKITDLILAVNTDKKSNSSYVPCIAWGKDAEATAKLPIGSALCIEARFQSRNYIKARGTSEETHHTAYEVSIMNIIKDDEK